MLVQILGRLFHFNITRQGCHHRLFDSLGAHFVAGFNHDPGEDHGRRNNGMPVPQNQRVNALV